MPFIGKNPTSGFSTIVKDDLTPDGSTTTFTLSKNVASANDIAVFVGNVRQEPTDAYSVSGTTLTMTAAPASGVNFYVLHIAGTLESSVVPAAGTTVPGAFGVSGDLTVDTNTLKVDATNNRVGIGTASPTELVDIAHSGSLVAGAVRIGDPSSISSNTGIYMRTTGLATIGAAGGTIVFDTNFGSSEKVRIDSDGMKFNGDTAAANALDDYEEGTFTPTLYHSSTNNSTFSSANGEYTRIGNTVTCQLRIDNGTSGTAGSFLVIGGLPFAVSQAQGNMGIGIWGSNPSQQFGNIHGYNPPRVFKGGTDVLLK